MGARHIILALAVVLGGACSKNSYRLSAPNAGVGGGSRADAAGGDGGMEMDYDDEMAPAPDAEPAERMEEGAAVYDFASTGPGDPTSGKKMPQAKPKPEPADNKPDVDPGARHIVYTAAMMVSVFNIEDAMATAESIPEKHGGYIQSMDLGQIVLRVPAPKLRTVMDEVAEYGVVEQRSLSSQDVTAEFVDIESRLKALEETHKQLLALLGKARTVKEALEVRQALDRITGELEVLKGRMRQLSNLISFSTLHLSLQERGPHMPTPSSNDPFPWVNDLGVESTEWR